MPASIEAKLRERVKELSCLNGISNVLTSYQGDLWKDKAALGMEA